MGAWLRRLFEVVRRRGRPQTLAARYERIARKIDPRDLQRPGGDSTISEADVLYDLTGEHFHTSRISGFYTETGFRFALERYGLPDRIRARGFGDLRLTFDVDDPKRQHITCHGTKEGREYLLMDLMTGRVRRPAPRGLEPADDLEMLSLEWVMLQDPSREFSSEHSRWPGQDYPGLGLNDEVMLLHIQSAKRLGLDGVVNHPSWYHIAYLGREHMAFLEPELQGRFDALREAMSELELADATWKMERGEVRWADDGSVVEWHPEDFVFATSDRLGAYLRSHSYAERRRGSREHAAARGLDF